RAAGDKTLPSDLRPPPVLKHTLDYLFRELLPKEGFSPTFDFIRDPLAMECHERCARFHILALHMERDRRGFSIAMEEQQLMNTLQSLKEFYEDQRDHYESPNELEMRIYHRLIHIRDQRERHEDIPPAILNHPVFLLTTKFRQHVQTESSPITKTSPLVVHEEGMLLFAELAALLREQGNRVMVYLVACILERLFGKDTIEDIESIRAGIAIPDIIDGVLSDVTDAHADITLDDYDEEEAFLREDAPMVDEPEEFSEAQRQPKTLKPSATEWLTNNFGVRPSPSAMLDTSGASSSTSVFGASSTSAFGSSVAAAAPSANFGSGSAFGGSSSPAFGAPPPAFGSSFPSAQGVSNPADDSAALRRSRHADTSFSPFGSSASTPAVLNAEGQGGAATSIFSSPFDRPTGATSQVPAAAHGMTPVFSSSQSAPSGFDTDMSHAGFGTAATPPTASAEKKHDRPPTATLNPKAPTFSPGHQFGTTPPPKPASDGRTTASPFGPSSTTPVGSTSSTPTRPILTPIDTSPLSSSRPSAPPRPPVNLPASQSAPVFNGFTKPSRQDRLERQSTVVDGFRPTTSEGSANPSPQQPPPLKVQPISLPGTPTATSFSLPQKQRSGHLFGWPSVQSMSSTDEILSPLVMSAKNSLASLPSPSTSSSRRTTADELPAKAPQDTAAEPSSSKTLPKSRISPISPQDVEMASPTAVPLRNGKAKGKSKSKGPTVDVEELELRASTFARTSALVRGALKRWAAKASERMVYNDAVRRSDAYVGHKTKKKRPEPRTTDTEPETKPPASRRTRRRISAKFTQPQTDAELARRLKENREQHERRWTPGTFLATLRAHVGNPAPFDYCLWLSLNPENDGTAIWVERKFDMPDSGSWASENVFSVPLAPGADSRSPGLVVFECSPLHGLEDEIEKKYRILDDCARLREVIEMFPQDRHFIPSVLFILWGADEAEALPGDLLRMVGDYATKGVIGSHATFSLSSKTTDLDEKFTEILGSMDLDTAGGLVEILSRQEFLQVVIAPWKDFAMDWVARLDWNLFSKVFEALVKLMNALSQHFTTRLDASASSSELYDAAFVWLERRDLRTPSREFRTLLQSYRTSDADFPVHAFVNSLYDMSVGCIEGSVKIDRGVRYPVPKRDIDETKREVESDLSETATQLRSVFLFHSRPKRPPPDDDDDDEASVLSMSPSSKRLKSTFSSFSTMEDLAAMPPPSAAVSPSASVTTVVNDDKPQKVVTVAMLRALSRSVLKNRPGT
ncbi:hypothetical protein EI94DRAFT_1758502, partial [Lactarius quietus]